MCQTLKDHPGFYFLSITGTKLKKMVACGAYGKGAGLFTFRGGLLVTVILYIYIYIWSRAHCPPPSPHPSDALPPVGGQGGGGRGLGGAAQSPYGIYCNRSFFKSKCKSHLPTPNYFFRASTSQEGRWGPWGPWGP